jgi:hypothetical protein
MGDFEQRAADISVSYPGVVQNYRSAREVVVGHSNGQSTTEGLRQAMVYFRCSSTNCSTHRNSKHRSHPMNELL